jgi:hypothetical protein
MKDASGSIRTSIQRQSGVEVAAAGERGALPHKRKMRSLGGPIARQNKTFKLLGANPGTQ